MRIEKVTAGSASVDGDPNLYEVLVRADGSVQQLVFTLEAARQMQAAVVDWSLPPKPEPAPSTRMAG